MDATFRETSGVAARLPRAWVMLAWLGFAGWAVAAFISWYLMGYGGLDDWCYFAPGAAATRPLGITMPLLGNFLGADHTWGIHSPGAPLLYSCIFAVVPWSPVWRVLIFVGMSTGATAATFFLLRRYVGGPVIAALGAGLLLCDRMFAGMAALARPEVISTLVLTVLVALLAGSKRGWRGAAAGGCFFLLPLLHPILLPLGGLLAAYVVWRAWQAGRPGPGLGLAACYAAGVAALAAWYGFQPDAWHQLQVHGKANYAPFGWGRTFLAYAFAGLPYVPALLYGLIFLGCMVVRPWQTVLRASDGESPQDWALPVVTMLGGTAAAQLFHNPFYQVILLPEAILLAIAVLERFARPERTAWVTRVLLVLVALSGLSWVIRTYKFFQAGRPSMRAEIHRLMLSLPPARTILIPDLLWEEGIRQPDRCFFYTPPFACSLEVRKAYEDIIFQRPRSGDLILINEHDLVRLTAPLPMDQWEYVRRYEHQLPGRAFWGYELTMYRRR